MDNYLTERYLRLPDGSLPHMGVRDGDVSPFVLLCGDPGRVERIAAHLDEVVVLSRRRGNLVCRGTFQNAPVTVAACGLGCPAVAIAVEELGACGGRAFIRLGSCASIHPEAQIGSLILATAAVRDEGTSPYYAPLNFPASADHRLVAALAASAGKLDLAYHLGVIRSTDSFYEGERSREVIDRWRRLGVLAFEMESSALFVVAASLGYAAASILVPGSNLIYTQSTYQGFGQAEFDHGVEAMAQVALFAISGLASAHQP